MLAGLIVACAEAEGEAVLRAELPIAGQTLIEHQARLLAAAGAAHIIILVERLPAPLLAAIDRLKRDGLGVDIARSVADAADRIHPEERLLLVADGLVTGAGTLDHLLSHDGSAILTLPDRPETAEWELIDAQTRWGGLLLLDGELMRSTSAMLGDWDLQSTLLRRAVQAGARFVEAPGGTLVILDSRILSEPVQDALGREAAEQPRGMVDRFIFAPLARLAAPRAMRAMLAPIWFDWAAIGLTLLAAIIFAVGWAWPGLVLLLLAGPVEAVGRWLATLAWRHNAPENWRVAATGAAWLALGWRLFRDGAGWGALLLAATAIALWVAIRDHHRFIGRPARAPLWLASLDELIWLQLPFALLGLWVIGLGAAALYLFATLLMTQRLTARKGNERP